MIKINGIHLNINQLNALVTLYKHWASIRSDNNPNS